MKLGIIGHGFVGKAVDNGFNREVEKYIVDPKYGDKTIESVIAAGVKTVFVCVPTPMSEGGEIDISIVSSVLELLDQLGDQDKKILTILKSTVTPQHVKNFETTYSNLDMVYNPEFLTEKNYLEDFIKPTMHVLGGKEEFTKLVEKLYLEHSQCHECPVFHMDGVTASFIKYTMNTFLAMKVIYFNQMYDVFKAMNSETSWETFISIVGEDPRMGNTHMMVPGNDGRRGFGGSCFPKDTEALIAFAKEQGADFTLLEEVMKVNSKVRG